MATFQKSNYSKRPSNGGGAKKFNNSASNSASKDGATSTTHYVKQGKEYVNSIFCWENDGEYGKYIKLRVTEALQPGDYFLSAKRVDNA